jgi:hypothetical protein
MSIFICTVDKIEKVKKKTHELLYFKWLPVTSKNWHFLSLHASYVIELISSKPSLSSRH